MAEILKKELQTYEAKKSELIGKSKGKFVLIKDDQVIDIFETKIDAIRQGYERFGNVPFLVKEIVEFDIPLDFTSKLFGEVSGLDDFLSLLFKKETDDEIEKFLKPKRIQELPDEEREWLEIKENEIHPAETEALKETEETEEVEEVEEVEEKEPKAEAKIAEIPHPDVVSESIQVEPKASPKIPDVHVPESILKTPEIEKSEWRPECEPKEAEIHFEEIQISKTKGHKTSDISSDNKSRSTPYDEEEEEEDENRIQDTLSSDDKKAIGKWGEGYILECLKKKLKAKYHEGEVEETEDGFTIRLNGRKIVKAHWLNKIEDTGEGYDIK